MIKIENFEVVGWAHAIRGLRNPMNSWDKSDSGTRCKIDNNPCNYLCESYGDCSSSDDTEYRIGPNDYKLMTSLDNSGTDHRKFMRMIVVYLDITAPLYWWKEFDTYKVGTVSNSCSTMHKIHAKEFTLEDFSIEKLKYGSVSVLENVIRELNDWRTIYLYGGSVGDAFVGIHKELEPRRKDVWWQMIQLLPSSYNQKRTIMLNYEVLANIYHSRKNHKLDEWREFCKWIESLPYSELITGGAKND